MLQDSPAEDEPVTGSAADLIPEPEPEKAPELDRPEEASAPTENYDESGEENVESQEIYTPIWTQEAQ